MNKQDLTTDAQNTWCAGCPNFMLLDSVKRALSELSDEEGLQRENVSMSTGIGCHGKMFDYLDVGGVYTLHGRVLPTCMGMKIGNPNQTVLGFGGDGDTFSEGMSHFINTARFNPDITLTVHQNQVFALTTGQATPTSEEGFETKAQPFGTYHKPLNPIKLAMSAGASFIARVNPTEIEHAKKVMKEAIEWDGFSFVESLFPCLVYHDDSEFLSDKTYKLEDRGHNPEDRVQAEKRADEWNYMLEGKQIPLGVIYKKRRKTLTEKIPQLQELKEEDRGWYQVER